MTIQTKLATAIATGAVLLNALAPMSYAATVVVSGNGDSSNSGVSVTNTNATTVSQTNTANVTNVVNSNASTGGNSASRNTGGNSVVDTGNATSKVDVSTSANVNQADVAGCNCGTDNTVLVTGNGVDSHNGVNVNGGNTTALTQTNAATINNYVDSNARTGGNDVNRNTGGSSSVMTGDAKSDVTVANAANMNVAHVGSANVAAGANSGSEVLITGNGDSSNNSVALNDHKSILLAQTNTSDIQNKVDSKALTGGNDANRNTGGNVSVDTGNATAKAHITNDPNFNVASVDDCGCTVGSFLKIAGNGVDSNNGISANEGNDLTVTGVNASELGNFVTPTAKTGGNDADRNTGAVVGIDPVTVFTGDATNDVSVHNSGNQNSFGQDMTIPGLGGVTFTTDFSSFWGAWMTWFSHQS